MTRTFTVADSFDYLENLYHRPITAPKVAGLKRIETLLGLLDDPQTAFPSVHVTGTCGKGSTATMIGSILDTAGYRTGIFRSPHLETYRERICVGTEMVSESEWLEVFQPVHELAESMEAGCVAGYEFGRVSLFELVWAMAALHFARSSIDVAVVEVGVGGRLSPTNILNPEVSVLTNVSLDHTGFLGPTEVDIAIEKAQIIKPGACAVTAATQEDVLEVIRLQAVQSEAPLWVVRDDLQFEIRSHDLEGESFDVRTPLRSYAGLEVGMLGRHQVLNAATAVGAIDMLAGRGIPTTEHDVGQGLRDARLPGRFEVICRDPLIVLDGARNVASSEVLVETITDLFPEREISLLIGILGDKDAEGMVEVLVPIATSAVVTEPPWEGRIGDLSRLQRALQAHLQTVEFEPDIELAFGRAVADISKDGLLLVTGSLYLVAAVRSLIVSGGMGLHVLTGRS